MKKLIDDVARVVPDLLEGVARLAPGIALLEGHATAVRADLDAMQARGEVALISGGGAGHEPAHPGYVGAGMLTAAVCGDVFTSPSTDAVLAAIRAVTGPAGALLIVKNYTGDRLNLGLAAEIARSEGLRVEMVVVADDVALAAGDDSAGRRGIAGTVLVHKAAGAAAAAGLDLAGVRAAAQAVIDGLGTMGVALSACTVPAAGQPGFALAEDEIELGLGIHGEPGVRRAPMAPAAGLVDELLGRIVADRGLAAGERVALLVNGLGGTPAMELAIVARDALVWLERRGLVVERAWSGCFLSALEMAGCSLSLVRLDDDTLARLDAPTTAPAWPPAGSGRPGPVTRIAPPAEPGLQPGDGAAGAATPDEATAWGEAVRRVCEALIAAEPELTRMDQAVGDGDLGISLARGAGAVLEELPAYDFADPAAALRRISATLRRVLGGTSGPLYAVFLLRAAAALEAHGSATPGMRLAAAFGAGCDGVAEVGGAAEGDCTMLDALLPARRILEASAAGDWRSDLTAALAAAREGCAATARLTARRGRASYLGERAVGHPDPGARAIVHLLAAILATDPGAAAA